MAGTGAKNFLTVEPEPEICVSVPQTYFLGKASCTNNAMVFSFQWTKSFGDGAKKRRCLEPEPEI